jgi:hypothetical protein
MRVPPEQLPESAPHQLRSQGGCLQSADVQAPHMPCRMRYVIGLQWCLVMRSSSMASIKGQHKEYMSFTTARNTSSALIDMVDGRISRLSRSKLSPPAYACTMYPRLRLCSLLALWTAECCLLAPTAGETSTCNITRCLHLGHDQGTFRSGRGNAAYPHCKDMPLKHVAQVWSHLSAATVRKSGASCRTTSPPFTSLVV